MCNISVLTPQQKSLVIANADQNVNRIVLLASEFLQRTSKRQQVREIHIYEFNRVTLVLEDNREVTPLILNLPKMDRQQLAVYIRQAHLLVTGLSDKDFKIEANLRICGGKPPKTHKIHKAALKGDVTLMEQTLADKVPKKYEVDVKNEKGETALHIACAQGHAYIAQMLINRSADVNILVDGSSPLHLAFAAGSVGSVTALSKNGANFYLKTKEGDSVLHLAAKHGPLDQVRNLLVGGFNDLDSKNNAGLPPIALACTSKSRDKMEMIDLLLQFGADPVHIPLTLADSFSNDIKKKIKFPLHFSCAAGNQAGVQRLINHYSVDQQDSALNTPLHVACMNNQMAIIPLLAEKSSKINQQNKAGDSALTLICAKGNFEAAKVLIAKGADVNIRNSEGYTALYYAVTSANPAFVEHLLVNNAREIDEETRQGTLLQIACKMGNRVIIDLLLDYGADPRKIPEKVSKDFSQELKNRLKFPLHQSCKAGDVKRVRTMLQHGVSVNLFDEEGSSAIHMAAMSGSAEIIGLLAEKKATIDIMNREDATALHIACALGHLDAAKKLVGLGADVRKVKIKDNGNLAIHLACKKKGNVEAVKVVAFDVNVKNRKGDTPLHFAAAAGCLETASYLLERGVTEIDALNQDKETPLQWACRGEYLELIDLLIQKGADPKKMAPNFYNNLSSDLKYRLNGNSELHLSCERGNVEEVRRFLEKGVLLESKNFNGDTPLHLACRNGNLAIIRIIAEKTTAIDAVNNVGETPLHIVCSKGNTEAARILLGKNSNVNQVKGDDFGSTPLILSCGANGSLPLVQLLVEKGAIPNEVNKKGDTALHLAAMNTNFAIVVFLAPRCEIDVMNKVKETPLAKAVSRGNLNAVDLLLQFGADPRKIPAPIRGNLPPAAKEKLINTPLHAACKAGSVEGVRQLLANGAKVDIINLEGDSPLHLLAKNFNSAIVSLLAEKSSLIDQSNQHGFTALHLFCSHGNTAGAEILIDRGAKVNSASDVESTTPVHCACGAVASEETLKMLSRRGANLDVKNEHGNTCLHLAAKHGSVPKVEFLLQQGVKEIDAVNKEGLTPLAEAALQGRLEIIDLLLRHKANPSLIKAEVLKQLSSEIQQRVQGNSALHRACLEGNVETARSLLEKGGADVANQEGNTPLHIACMQGNSELIALVAAKSHSIDLLNQRGESALHIVCAKGNWQGALPLIQQRANVHLATAKSGDRPIHLACGKEGNLELVKALAGQKAIDEKNFNEDTPLHFAAVWGHASILAFLLSSGLQESKNREGKTPLTYACLNQHLTSIDLLRLNGANLAEGVSAVYNQLAETVKLKLAEPLLHVACRVGDVDVVTELLAQGVKTDPQDHEGNTALHLSCVTGNLAIIESVANKSREIINRVNKKGETPLHMACLAGLENRGIDLLVQNGAQLNLGKEDNGGNTPLILACGMGHLETAKHLVQKEADVHLKNKKGLNALYYAAAGGHFPVAAYLLEMGVKGIDEALAAACSAGNGPMVDLLLQYGANPKNISASDPVIQAKLKNPPLHAAVKEGRIEEVRALVRKAVSVDIADEEGNTPLHLACMKGNGEMIGLIAAKSKSIDSVNKEGCTPLHIVCTTGFLDGITSLVQRNGSVNLPKGDELGHSPLMLACCAADLNVIKFLVASEAEINFRNKKGNTLLHLAVAWGRADIIEYLFSISSCAIDAVNNAGETALAVAALRNQMSLVNLLLKRAAPAKILPSIQERLSADMRHVLFSTQPLAAPMQAFQPKPMPMAAASIQPLQVKPVKPVAPTLLSDMCQTHDLDFIEMAIRKGARPDGKTLTFACLTANPLIVDAILALNALPDEKSLPAACSTGNPVIVQKILQKGAQITLEAQQIARRTGNQTIMRLLGLL